MALLLLAGLSVAVAAPASAACDSAANPVLCENALPGSPASEWDVSGLGDPGLQGFATDISVNEGETVHFKVDTADAQWHANIYRLGYYGGSGARLVGATAPAGPQGQPPCMTDSSTGLVDCGNWSESSSWAVPSTAVSGVYIAGLVANADGTGSTSHIVFIVRDDASRSKLLFQTSDTTWQAYNTYGGNSLYTGSPDGRAYKVSYNRPFITRDGITAEDWLFNSEYPMIRWLEANGYDVSYTTGIDSDRRGNLIQQHRTFLSVGHDEYWSGTQRTNVEKALTAGVNLAFFSGNEMFWKTRLEPSIAGPATANRTLVSYKETQANAKIDPTPAWTGTWRDPRFSPPADGGRPENALTGQLFMVNEGTAAIQVPAALGKDPFWRHTTVATQAAGAVATLAAGTLGYEWDVDVNNGARPAGLVHLSSTTVNVPSLLLDNGSTYGPGTATHTLTRYRAASGALVFGAGTVQWPWGLDSYHDRGNGAPDIRMQQATLNILADMGAQPGSVQGGLVTDSPTSTSTTTAPPVVLGATARSGYWMIGDDGKVYPFGDAKDLGNPSASLGGVRAMDIEPTPSLNGYWVVDSTGRVFAYGDAVTRGNANLASLAAGETITSLSRTKSGNGYWLFTTKGRALPFGDATFLGDMSAVKLNGPVLGSVATPSGLGYFMVASDGGIFTFGDAKFVGSMGSTKLNAPVRSMVPTPDGTGYWLVAGDGGIFAFTAPFRGSMGSTKLNKPVVGMVANGNGYLMVAADGGIFNFSDQPFAGSLGNTPPTHPITAVATLN